jgi:uncharacterized membrane protein
MSPREGLLFVHLLAVAAFFMSLGIETLFIVSVADRRSPEDRSAWFKRMGANLRVCQIAMVAILVTGGPLTRWVPEADKPAFAVTLAMFVFLGALTGYGASKSRATLKSNEEPTATVFRAVLVFKLCLAVGILMLISVKLDLRASLAVFATATALGILTASRYGKRSPITARS